jgi:hypothetical protein
VLAVVVVAGLLVAAVLVSSSATARSSHRPRGASVPSTLTVPTIRTFRAARTGNLIRCVNHGVSAGAHVPRRGQGLGVAADGKRYSVELELTRRMDGSLRVSCQA